MFCSERCMLRSQARDGAESGAHGQKPAPEFFLPLSASLLVNVCWWCDQTAPTLRKCPICFSVHYCSEDCEMASRCQGFHMGVCKAIAQKHSARQASSSASTASASSGWCAHCRQARVKPASMFCSHACYVHSALKDAVVPGMSPPLPVMYPDVRHVCWWCHGTPPAGEALFKCPRCFAAYYCCQECEMADLFYGDHACMCSSMNSAGELARMVFRLSRGCVGLALSKEHPRYMQPISQRFVMVAKAKFAIGSIVMRAPAVSGFPSSIGFINGASHWISAESKSGERLFPPLELSGGMALTIYSVEEVVLTMFKHVWAARGVPMPAMPEQTTYISLLRQLRALKLDDESYEVLHDLVTWILRERSVVDSFWKHLDTRRMGKSKIGVPFDLFYKSLHAKGDLVELLAQVYDRVPPEVAERAKVVEVSIQMLRRRLPMSCRKAMYVWHACRTLSPGLGIRHVDVGSNCFMRVQHPVTEDSMASLSLAGMMLVHNCAPNCQVSTTRIMEGIVCSKREDWQGMHLPEYMMSDPYGTLYSESTVFAHQGIDIGSVLTITFTECRTKSELELSCPEILNGMRIAFPFCKKLVCACQFNDEYCAFKYRRVQALWGLSLKDSVQEPYAVYLRTLASAPPHSGFFKILTCIMTQYHRTASAVPTTSASVLTLQKFAEAIRPFHAAVHEQLFSLPARDSVFDMP